MMKKNSIFWSLLTMIMVGMMSVAFVACSDDKDDPDSVIANPTSVSFSSSGGSQVVSVTSNRDWIVTNAPSWLTASKVGTSSLSLNANSNTESSSRSCTLLLTAGTATATVNVSQSGVVAPTQVTITNSSTYTLPRFRVVFLNARSESLVDQDYGTLSPGRTIHADIPTAAKEYYMATYMNSKWFFSPNYDISYTTLNLSTAEVGGWSSNSSSSRR